MQVEDLKARAEEPSYHRALGVRLERAEPDRISIRIPYKDDNSNPGRALHGGVSASAINIAGSLVAWGGLAERADLELGTLDLSVTYLAAAIGEDIVATAEVLRRGKEITYSQVDVRTDAGKRIAAGLVTSRAFDVGANPAARDRQLTTEAPPVPATQELIKGAPMFVMSPFIRGLGLQVADAHGGQATLTMAVQPQHGDARGAVHEGALAALIDTTGALASWTLTGLDMRFKASTVGIHVNYHAPVRDGAVTAQARTMRRNNEVFLNQVTVSGADSGIVVASGSVTYRIVLPD